MPMKPFPILILLAIALAWVVSPRRFPETYDEFFSTQPNFRPIPVYQPPATVADIASPFGTSEEDKLNLPSPPPPLPPPPLPPSLRSPSETVAPEEESTRTADLIIKSDQRVVVCISGNSRTFYSPIVHDNIRQNLVERLRKYHKTVDVIFNIKLELTNPNPDEGQPLFPVTLELLREAMNTFSPVYIHELTDREDFDSVMAPHVKDKEGGTMYQPANCEDTAYDDCIIPYSLYRQSQCRTRIMQHEEKTGVPYDFVYVTRPDVFYLNDITFPKDMVNGTIYTNTAPQASTEHIQNWWTAMHQAKGKRVLKAPSVSDITYASTRADADLGLQSVMAAKDCDFFNIDGTRNTESQLMFWLIKNDFQVESKPWMVAIVQYYMGIECHIFSGTTIQIGAMEVDAYQFCHDVNGDHIRIKV